MRTKIVVAALVMVVGLGTVAVAQQGRGRAAGGCRLVGTLPVGTLDAGEAAGVLFTREEEKLARDVYMALFETWHQQEFARIAGSEQRHMDAMKSIIDRHGLVDPVGTNPAGVFANPELAALYADLVARGRQSLQEALVVGATIEDLDLADIGELLAATDEADLQAVYQNLSRGSRNHLRAFSAALADEGMTYVPQHITPEAYASILAAGWERGTGGGQGAGRGRGGQGRGGRGGCSNPGMTSGQGSPGQGGNRKGPGRS